MSEQEYQRLIRKFPSVAARLHQAITVRRVAGGCYTTEFHQLPGEIYASLPDAQDARRSLICRELQAMEGHHA